MSDFVCTVSEGGEDGCEILIGGDVCVSSAQQLHQALTAGMERRSQVVLRLRDVTGFDAAGMQVLLSALAVPGVAVSVQLGEQTECALHWLRIAGLVDALAGTAKSQAAA